MSRIYPEDETDYYDDWYPETDSDLGDWTSDEYEPFDLT